MSDNYLFKPDSTILNSLAFGSDAGSSLVDPQLRMIIAQNRSLDVQKQISEHTGASLVGQRISHDLQRETNDQLQDLSGGVERLGQDMADGMNGIAYSISDGMSRQNELMAEGFGEVGDRLGDLASGMNAGFQELSEVTQEGFQQLGLGLRSGFQSVVRGLYHVDERLGQRLMLGFSAVSRQMQQQHEESQATLIEGFDFVSDAIGRAGDLTVGAIEQSTHSLVQAQSEATQTQVAALAAATQAQLQATQSAADQIAHAVVETGRLQTKAMLVAFRQQSQQLDALRHDVRHPAANEATEHFLVGMNFLNHLDFDRACEQFQKARERYAGHFPTLFAEGFCCFVLGNPDAAQDSFEAALSQIADDPDRARRQRALAELYLGRLAFDRGNYKRAQRHFEHAYTDQPAMWNALVEAAASLLLDPTRTDRAADAKAVQRLFNSQPHERAYLHWYLLALLLARLAPDIAREAFRAGATGDYRAREQNRVEVIELLWRLHPRQVASLLGLVQDEFPWLR